MDWFNDTYQDISPFEGQDFEDAISRLRQYPQLLNNFTDIISRRSRVVNSVLSFRYKGMLRELLSEVHNYTDFQEKITCNLFLDLIEKSSIDHLTYDGIEQLGEDKPRIYISNHRDIVLDTALLDLALYRSGKSMCEMVIGDNLLVNQFTTDMFKVNGAVTVKRTFDSASQMLEETLRLSRYLTYVVGQKKKSVWIAQKSGRNKDGVDNTTPAILKMLYMSSKTDDGLSFSEFLKKVSIVPVAISYQYDPCDVTKGQSEIKKLKAEGCYDVYRKKKYADVIDMVRGFRMYKGNVHIQVGTPLDSSIKSPKEAAGELDRQIHLNYRLWNTNYYAYDYLNGSEVFKNEYKGFDGEGFIRHYSAYNREVADFVINSYANSVRSMLNEKNS